MLTLFTPILFSAPPSHDTGIAKPRCVERLPSDISKMVVSTVAVVGCVRLDCELFAGRSYYRGGVGLPRAAIPYLYRLSRQAPAQCEWERTIYGSIPSCPHRLARSMKR